MRFMIIVKANKDSEAGVMPEEKLIAAMATYHEELAKAGALLDASGLQPSSKGLAHQALGREAPSSMGPSRRPVLRRSGQSRRAWRA